MHHHKHSAADDTSKLVGIAAMAAAIGAGVALLFTPRSGDQVRGGIKRRINTMLEAKPLDGDNIADTAAEAKAGLKSAADKVVDEAKSTAAKAKDDTKAATATVKKAADKKDS